MKYTEEQMKIIESEGDIKVNAVAGSGKTSTLVEYCKQRLGVKILYLVFNKSAKLDAQKKFNEAGVKHVKVQTAHSLAYGAIVPANGYSVANSLSEHAVKNILKLHNLGTISGYVLAKHIANYLELYFNSTEERIVDVDYIKTLTPEAKEFCQEHEEVIQQGVAELIDRMDKGKIAVTHNFYLKKYQMSNPKLNYDYILYDEFQDSNPVMIDIFMKQDCTKVCVGDTHQQIYAWRGAINALETIDFDELFLTKSFRFGQDIADSAMDSLGLKKLYNEDYEPITIEGAGDPSDDVKTRAILARGNLTLLKKAIDMIHKDEVESVYFEGGLNNYTFMSGINIYDVYNLYYCNYNYIRNNMLKAMKSFNELIEYAEKSGDQNVKMLIEIVKMYQKNLPTYFKKLGDMNIKDDKDKYKADVIFSTIHKSKGLEYDKVELCSDFITKGDIMKMKLEGKLKEDKVNENINILYVAKTRAKHKLIQLYDESECVEDKQKGSDYDRHKYGN